jgi:hypothetical protein
MEIGDLAGVLIFSRRIKLIALKKRERKRRNQKL